MLFKKWAISVWSFISEVSSDCTSVVSFNDFITAIESSTSKSSIQFCPFVIDKVNDDSFVNVTSDITISCYMQHMCMIRGPGNHISVYGENARLHISDFVFLGATNQVIRIDSTATNNAGHEIRRCIIRDNDVDVNQQGQQPGAIEVGVGVTVKIVGSRLARNVGNTGGAIVFGGKKLTLNGVRFDKNHAMSNAGAIYLTSTAQSINITNSIFTDNLVTDPSNAGAIYAENIESVEVIISDGVWAAVDAKNNTGCNGIYDATTNQCYPLITNTHSSADVATKPTTTQVSVPRSAPSRPAPRSVPAPVSRPSAPYTKFVLGSLRSQKDGIRLSQGLTARIIAQTGQFVQYTSPDATRSSSTLRFHSIPDGAAIFELNDGGYVYTSNSEIDNGGGGVYGVEFDQKGRVRNYKSLLSDTDRNCNGGRTPWDTWVSCEEVPGGQCWQVDPTGNRSPEVTVMGGNNGGSFEAFAYDARDTTSTSYYVTEDVENGALRRYRPPKNTALNWDLLHGSGGTLDYLEFISNKRFRWTTSLSTGRSSAKQYYPNSEGIAVQNGKLHFVSKVNKQLFTLDLDNLTYTVVSTRTSTLPGGGIFGDQPDHVIVTTSGVILLTEDGGSTPGLFAYDGSQYLSYFESNYDGDEVVGIAFSPDKKYMFAVIQDAGLLFQISRDDGQKFDGRRILHTRK